MRPDFALFRFCITEVCGLRLREEIYGPRTIREINVRRHSNNFVHSRVFRRAEMLPYRVLFAKEPLGKRLVDYGYRLRIRVVLFGDRPSHHDLVPENLEESRRHAGPTR